MPSSASLSVIIPAYCRERWLIGAVRSVLAQTHPNLEVIVVDDGSPRPVGEALALLQQRDPRLRVVRQQNQGPAAARNRGIRESRGRFIGFLDSDDVWAPRWWGEMQRVLRRHPACGVALCQCVYFHDEKGTRTWLHNPRRIWSGEVTRELTFGNFIPICNALVRRPLLERVCFDPALSNDQDWDLWARMALAGVRFVAHPAVLAAVRLHPEQRSKGGAVIARCRLRILAGLERRLRAGVGPHPPSVRRELLAIVELRRAAQLLALGRYREALSAIPRGVAASPITWLWALHRKATAYATKQHQLRATIFGRSRLF